MSFHTKMRTLRRVCNDKLVYQACKKYDAGSVFGKVLARLVIGNKKIVVLYGHCHMTVYRAYLEQCREFKKRYKIFGEDLGYIGRFFPDEINDKSIWNHANFVVYNPWMPIPDGLPKLEEIQSKMAEETKLINITNAAFKGYFPQHTTNSNERFCWGDKNLNNLLDSKNPIDDEMIEQLLSENYYSTETVNKYFDGCIKNLRTVEKFCDIGIVDFIEKYGRTKVLYYSMTHPTNEVMFELSLRLLHEIGIEKDITPKTKKKLPNLRHHAEVIYPSVWRALGIVGDPYERKISPGNDSTENCGVKEYFVGYIEDGLKRDGNE